MILKYEGGCRSLWANTMLFYTNELSIHRFLASTGRGHVGNIPKGHREREVLQSLNGSERVEAVSE